MNRFRRNLAYLCTGGVTLGVIQAADMISFADLFTQFLATLLSVIVALLFGGDLSSLGFTNGV